ncbi:MAG: triose-phosphate isomerase [Desulfomicrobium escambiense]|nr:triose-phosphate isomerase [Desulfomicrobium escambiense]
MLHSTKSGLDRQGELRVHGGRRLPRDARRQGAARCGGAGEVGRTRMRKSLIAGNWKMFKTLDEAVLFAEELARRVADVSDSGDPHLPAVLYIHSARRRPSTGTRVMVGAQNVLLGGSGRLHRRGQRAHAQGALGARYAIIGHSERRQYFARDRRDREQAPAWPASKAGLTPIVVRGRDPRASARPARPWTW